MKKTKGSRKKKKSVFKKLLRRVRRSGVAARLSQVMQTTGLFHRSRAESGHSSTPAIELDDRYAIDGPSWNRLLERLLNGGHSNRQALAARPIETLDTLVVAVTPPAAGHSGDGLDADLSTTLRSVDRMRSVTDFRVKVAVLDGQWPHPPSRETGFSPLVLSDIRALTGEISGRDLVLFLNAGDEVMPELGAVISERKLFDKKLALCDLFFEEENKVIPLFLPGFNCLHGIFCDYFRSRFLIRGDILVEASTHYPEAGPYELARAELSRQFLVSDRSAGTHVPLPLVKIRESQERLLDERLGCLETRWDDRALPAVSSAIRDEPCVSVVISTKDKGHLVRQLLTSLLNTQMDLVRDVTIVSNGTTAPHAVATLRQFARHERVRVVNYQKEFNFSAQSNVGAAASKGDYLLFLNDDIVPVSTDWVYELLRMCALPKVGIVAPLLVYPDERVQHAGMFLGFNGVAGHALRFARLPDEDYLFMGSAPRLVSVVTGAAFMIKRSLFENLNGFDTRFATYIQDVDLCLRVRGSGYHVVFDPRAVLIHMESVTLKGILDNPVIQDRRGREHALFAEKWKGHLEADPFHNANFEPNDEMLRRIREPKEIAPAHAPTGVDLGASERHGKVRRSRLDQLLRHAL